MLNFLILELSLNSHFVAWKHIVFKIPSNTKIDEVFSCWCFTGSLNLIKHSSSDGLLMLVGVFNSWSDVLPFVLIGMYQSLKFKSIFAAFHMEASSQSTMHDVIKIHTLETRLSLIYHPNSICCMLSTFEWGH